MLIGRSYQNGSWHKPQPVAQVLYLKAAINERLQWIRRQNISVDPFSRIMEESTKPRELREEKGVGIPYRYSYRC